MVNCSPETCLCIFQIHGRLSVLLPASSLPLVSPQLPRFLACPPPNDMSYVWPKAKQHGCPAVCIQACIIGIPPYGASTVGAFHAVRNRAPNKPPFPACRPISKRRRTCLLPLQSSQLSGEERYSELSLRSTSTGWSPMTLRKLDSWTKSSTPGGTFSVAFLMALQSLLKSPLSIVERQASLTHVPFRFLNFPIPIVGKVYNRLRLRQA